jgi:large subunit ribosomal protein L10
MSKPVKELLRKELAKRLEDVTSLAIVGFTGIDAIATHQIRGRLRQKEIRLTVVKNSVARQAFKSVGMEPAADLLDGPCAVAYGADSVVTIVRELLEIGKDNKNLTVKGAVLDGDIFGADRIVELSKYPTRGEAVSRAVGCILSPGRRLAACLIGPGARIASILKTVQERHEKAEPAAPVEAAAAPAAVPDAPAAPAAAPDAPAAPVAAPDTPAAPAAAPDAPGAPAAQ